MRPTLAHVQRPHPHTASTPEHHPVFGKPLKDSLRRASVQVSTANTNGDLYVWGYIPVVVAKWSVSAPSPSRPTHSPQRSLSQRKRYISPPRQFCPTYAPQLPRSKALFV